MFGRASIPFNDKKCVQKPGNQFAPGAIKDVFTQKMNSPGGNPSLQNTFFWIILLANIFLPHSSFR